MSLLTEPRKVEVRAAADELGIVKSNVANAKIVLNHLTDVQRNNTWINLRDKRRIPRAALLSSMSAVLRTRQRQAERVVLHDLPRENVHHDNPMIENVVEPQVRNVADDEDDHENFVEEVNREEIERFRQHLIERMQLRNIF